MGRAISDTHDSVCFRVRLRRVAEGVLSRSDGGLLGRTGSRIGGSVGRVAAVKVAVSLKVSAFVIVPVCESRHVLVISRIWKTRLDRAWG